jgi:hypothetical protein
MIVPADVDGFAGLNASIGPECNALIYKTGISVCRISDKHKGDRKKTFNAKGRSMASCHRGTCASMHIAQRRKGRKGNE